MRAIGVQRLNNLYRPVARRVSEVQLRIPFEDLPEHQVELLAIDEIACGVPHSEEQVHGAASIGADEACQRRDTGAGADQDQRSAASARMERRIATQEGVDGPAWSQFRKLPEQRPAAWFLTTISMNPSHELDANE